MTPMTMRAGENEHDAVNSRPQISIWPSEVKPRLNSRHGLYTLRAFGNASGLKPLEPVRGTTWATERRNTHMIEYLKTWRELNADRRGVTMLEYGLIAALIAVVCITAVTSLGTNLSSTFHNVSTSVGTGG
jgi:pilus assembly protein Flp/PilA